MNEERLAEYTVELITEIDFIRSVRDGQARMIRKLHVENREHIKEIARLRKALTQIHGVTSHEDNVAIFGDMAEIERIAKEALDNGD